MQTVHRQDVWWREVTGGERWECDQEVGQVESEMKGEKTWACGAQSHKGDWFSSNILVFTLLLALEVNA